MCLKLKPQKCFLNDVVKGEIHRTVRHWQITRQASSTEGRKRILFLPTPCRKMSEEVREERFHFVSFG
jgi:hypothetical protein